MMDDQTNLETTLAAVNSIGLPVWAGITTGPCAGRTYSPRKGDLCPAVRALAAAGVDLINIMDIPRWNSRSTP